MKTTYKLFHKGTSVRIARITPNQSGNFDVLQMSGSYPDAPGVPTIEDWIKQYSLGETCRVILTTLPAPERWTWNLTKTQLDRKIKQWEDTHFRRQYNFQQITTE